jgi:nucleotide-binding universal stress UspA family protein
MNTGFRMKQLQKIVVGHDFRTGGEVAAQSAAELAKRCGAALKLIHVVEPYPLYQRVSYPLTPPYPLEELTQKAGEKLEALATSAEYGLSRVEYEVRTGKPFVELILVRRAWQADLIVVGSAAEEERRFLGSTGERVLRKAMVPVLVAKKRLTAEAKTFLVPTDFSPSTKKAAEEAITLAESFGGQIRFFHALELPYYYAPAYGSEMGAPLPPPMLTPDDVEEQWQAFLSELPTLKNISWEKHTEEGHAVTSIIQHATESQADLIVMSTHGRSSLAHMLLGSVAEGVARGAPCSVLTIRPDAFQFELP